MKTERIDLYNTLSELYKDIATESSKDDPNYEEIYDKKEKCEDIKDRINEIDDILSTMRILEEKIASLRNSVTIVEIKYNDMIQSKSSYFYHNYKYRASLILTIEHLITALTKVFDKR